MTVDSLVAEGISPQDVQNLGIIPILDEICRKADHDRLDAWAQAGGIVAGVGSIVDRTGGEIDFGVPYKSVISMKVEAWEPDNCPLCKEGKIELVKPGSRKLKVK